MSLSIRAVFFDADDTLFTVTPGVGKIYARFFNAHGFAIDEDAVTTAVAEVWSGFKRTYENAEDDYRTWPSREREMWFEFISRVAHRCGLVELSQSLQQELYNYFSLAESRKVFPGVRESLTWLHSRGVITGVLTNNDDRMFALLDELRLTGLLHHVIPTTTLGYKKPSPRAFESVSNRLGLAPEEIVYIGDSIELDYQGARRAGWHALWFNRHRKEASAEVVQFQCHTNTPHLIGQLFGATS